MNHSREWHEERRKFLGASEVPIIMGFNKYQSPYELWQLKRGEIEPFVGNEATWLGHQLEPVILDRAEQELGQQLLREVSCVHENGLMRATLDGQCIKSGEPVEAKTAGIASYGDTSAWGEPGLVEQVGQVPIQYYVQVQAQLLCSGQELAHLFGLIAGQGYAHYQIKADPAFHADILDECGQWWEKHITNGETPSFEHEPLRVIKGLKREPESEIELPIEALDLVQTLDDFKLAHSHANKIKKEAELELLKALGECEVGLLPDGRRVTYLETTRKGYEVKDSTFRTLRIKK